MDIRLINNKNQWEDFLQKIEEKTFLHSWAWGEFQKQLGEKIWRLGIFKQEKMIAAALIIKIKAKRGSFLLCPHGPVVRLKDTEEHYKVLKLLLEYLKPLAKQEGASFIRISPILESSEENEKVFHELGFKKAPIHIHSENNWLLNLEKTEEELLSEMRKSTRSLIKKGLKNSDLEIIKTKNIEDVKLFNQVYQKTAQRQKFVPFSLDYLEKEFSIFDSENGALIFLAKYKGETIASAIIIFWQDMAFYHQGASLQEYPDIPASHLLQWEAIKEAKNRGCRNYSFWGIAPDNMPEHPWRGITVFKKGFGGIKIEYVKTKDYPLSWKYLINYLIEKKRAKKRGFC